MPTSRDELESFHQFALGRLAGADSPDSLDDLLGQWRDLREQQAVNAAIRRGLKDVDQGRFEPAERSLEELREQLGFPKP